MKRVRSQDQHRLLKARALLALAADLITQVDEGSPIDEVALLDLQTMISEADTLLVGQIDGRLRDRLEDYMHGITSYGADEFLNEEFEDTEFQEELVPSTASENS
jgi:hypothetical protein